MHEGCEEGDREKMHLLSRAGPSFVTGFCYTGVRKSKRSDDDPSAQQSSSSSSSHIRSFTNIIPKVRTQVSLWYHDRFTVLADIGTLPKPHRRGEGRSSVVRRLHPRRRPRSPLLQRLHAFIGSRPRLCFPHPHRGSNQHDGPTSCRLRSLAHSSVSVVERGLAWAAGTVRVVPRFVRVSHQLSVALGHG